MRSLVERSFTTPYNHFNIQSYPVGGNATWLIRRPDCGAAAYPSLSHLSPSYLTMKYLLMSPCPTLSFYPFCRVYIKDKEICNKLPPSLLLYTTDDGSVHWNCLVNNIFVCQWGFCILICCPTSPRASFRSSITLWNSFGFWGIISLLISPSLEPWLSKGKEGRLR